MTNSFVESLNPKQKEAVVYCDGHELVLAGAGSGKTRVLTTKIAYLIDEKNILPWRILALTFTNKAAKEMRGRVEKLLGSNLKGMEVSTFHAYGLRFLHRYGDALEELGYSRNFVIFDRSDVKTILKKIYRDMDIDPQKLNIGEAIEIISMGKTNANPVSREPAISPKWREVYDRYQKELLRHNALDFDDLLVLPLHILAINKDVREKERSRLDWILVDEYQDVNTTQYLLLRCLVDAGRKIMVVGDPDQSIYGWRGADMNMILNFEKDFNNVKVIILDQNYRSTNNILSGANNVIKNNRERYPKDLWTDSGSGQAIKIYRAKNDLDESEWIAKKIESLIDDGYDYNEIAILYRMNVLSRGLEQALLERTLPYHVIRGLAFYERAEVKDVLSMMRLAVNPRDTVSLSRVANIPPRGLGKKSVEQLTSQLALMGELEPEDIWREIGKTGGGLKGKAKTGTESLAHDMINILNDASDLRTVVENILYLNKYEEYLKTKHTEDWESRVENVLEILSLVPEDGDVAQVLTEIPLYTDQDTMVEQLDGINLLTLHAAKGLEFPVVFLVGMEEGIFPSIRSVEGESDLSEERRLCYVGMTRAKEKLFMSSSASRLLFGSIQRNRVSRFVGEIPSDYTYIEDATYGGTYRVDDRFNRRRWRW
ncbi:MAG: UvrD-helicase domain-containing protein [Synergistaceae bacterium]|nr:UvrD-helicase domain-containing protein [Synergistaceae bacterium]